jgi:protein-tyrosine phosphatase
MIPKLYPIETPWPGRLAIAARPRGADWLGDEIRGFHHAGVDVLVCLLTDAEMEQLGLQEEGDWCAAEGIRFFRLPIEDRDIPESADAARELVETLGRELEAGRSVAVHCRQGIGRSGMIAALVLAGAGIGAHEALRRVSDARGLPVPETAAQLSWLRRMAERLPAVHAPLPQPSD